MTGTASSEVEASRKVGRAKGSPKTGGRQRGTPNKVTADMRESIRQMLEKAAPQMSGWLERVAKESPAKALELALRAAEFAIPKLTRTSVELEADNLAAKLKEARLRVQVLDEIERTDGQEFRREVERLMPPLYRIVTGVPEPEPVSEENEVPAAHEVPEVAERVRQPPPMRAVRIPMEEPAQARDERTPHNPLTD